MTPNYLVNYGKIKTLIVQHFRSTIKLYRVALTTLAY